MRNSSLYGALGALCLSLPVGVRAEGIPTIVITPTRFAQPLGQVVAPTTVVTRDDIRNSGAQTVAGVLRAYAGFDVTQLGGAGQQTSVFLQGTNSNMVRVLVDGVPVNDATSGGAAWSTLPVGDIERIEVVKGPLSTLWGSDAIGGVVNIITRKPPGNGGRIGVAAGNHGTREGRLSLHGASGSTRGGISIGGERTDGEPVVQGFSERAAYDNRNLNAYASTRLGRLAVDANLWRNRGRQEYVTGGPPYSAYALDSQAYLSQVSSLRLSLPLTAGWQVAGHVEQTRNRLQQDQTDVYVTPPAQDYARSTRNAFEAQLGYAAGGTHLLFGANRARTHADSLSYGTAYDGYRTSRAGFLEWRQQVGGAALTAAARRTLDSQYGGHNTWSLGVSLPLPYGMRFKLSSGTGYHAPTFNDLYGYGGNPALEPETSRSAEAQLVVPVAGSGLLTVTAYRHRLRNLIETVLIDPSTYTYENVNVGDARVRGLELSGSWQSGPWNLGASADWQDPRNLDTGKPLLRRASHQYRVRLAWESGRWNAATTWMYTGGREGVQGQRLAPYRLIDLSAHYRFDRRWSAKLQMDNVLDTAYTPAYYGKDVAYLGPGRTTRLGLEYAFGTV